MSSKAANLYPLTLAISMGPFKSSVVEGIADLLVKLPLDPIADKSKLSEIDIQTRYYDPLLSSMVADTTKEFEDTLTTVTRPDAIVSSLVQRTFRKSAGFGEVKLGDDSTTNHSLCLDTLKLAALSRNSALKHSHPVLTFQVNEIGRITVPGALSCLRSFITLKSLRTLLLLLYMIENPTSKSRDCSVQYK
ncbi:hypothetical protein BCV72DRAFT_254045 [Rhizopus microsporus var. microsporus]|uniref:Uncharacterized protein n=1 Tax=Rhizopus microsporus var. microsporus TaxID=86635 RepID=A0A1X0RFS0_RHIZD|nr:hypothetical protein BCV72DRAFT_254045 [Rhizopus microsporus var. microsporus]